MSAYGVTTADLKTRLGTRQLTQLTTENGSGSAPDDAVVAAAIDAAEAELHLAAAVYYVTPLQPSPAASPAEAQALTAGVRERVIDAAAYKLLQRNPSILNSGERSTYWSSLRKSVERWLEQLRSSDEKTRVVLPGALQRDVAVASNADAWAESDTNVFSQAAMRGWH